MHITSKQTNKEAAVAAAGQLTRLLSDTEHTPTLLLLSGGSSLHVVGQLGEEVARETLTLTVVDDRYSADPSAGNFAAIAGTDFYQSVLEAGGDVISPRLHTGESLEEAAQRFEQAVRQWEEAHPGGMMIAILGIGTDGHTAGIMPFPENRRFFRRTFNDGDRWVVGYDATREKNEYPLRMTVTLPLLRRLNAAVVYAVGEEKEEALRKVLAEEGALHTVPARIVHEIEDVYVFTDRQQIAKQ